MSGGFWSLLTVVGPLVLGLVILWAILKNRKGPQAEIDRTDHAAHERILEQDVIDKQRDIDART